MLGRTYEDEVCSAARALEVVGERWSLLILRNAMFAGHTRFSDFQRSLGVAPNILTKRLADFVAAGLMETSGHGHAEYVLTDKGRDLVPTILALTAWGDRWAAPDGPPITYRHRKCGGAVEIDLACTACDAHPSPADVDAEVADWAHARKYGSPSN
jgi:DNA-binding HxlR family transcriptional regulator